MVFLQMSGRFICRMKKTAYKARLGQKQANCTFLNQYVTAEAFWMTACFTAD